MRSSLVLVAAVLLAFAAAAPAQAFDPTVEASNFAKGNERAAIYDTPEYQVLLRQISAQNAAAAALITARDPEREFNDHLCQNGVDGCAGDARLYDWGPKGYGIVQPVLWTARSGATISGRVWATKAGPAKRPGIVITNGSVQANEQLYWFAAQTLAKAGYVVLTWDPQGQGQSDTPGAAPDLREGVPAQTDGRPFFDGTVDALDFFFSTPQQPFEPRKSCESGTSHADKQDRRVKAGLDAAYNPYWAMLDTGRVGIAGHSYGAAGVSYVGQSDPRVKALVAWDNLGPADPNAGGTSEQPCPADPSARAKAPITKPALGMSADYYIPPTPNTSDPDPLAKSEQSRAYSQAGVDTGEVVIRGGTHFDFDFIPNNAFTATLRGADEIAWYSLAWFDKYVKGDPAADDRVLSDRWRADAAEGAVDPGRDANTFSFYYRSRLDVRRTDGTRVTCENLRDGCAGLVPKARDGFDGEFDYLKIATSPDGATGPGLPTSAPPAGGGPAAGGGAAGHGKHTAKLQVRRLRILRGSRRLDVLAPITRRASGRVRVEVHAAHRRYHFTVPIDTAHGRLRFKHRIPRAQARLGTGIVTLRYAGDADTRPQVVRLRAAAHRAGLQLARPKLADGRLRASGSVSRRARGKVRVQLEWVRDGHTTTLRSIARIRHGRWRLDRKLTTAIRTSLAKRQGTVHSYTLYTGYLPLRIRGEMRAYQVLGPR